MPRPTRKKRSPNRLSSSENKVCSACGAENAAAASECTTCRKKRFEPLWVRAHYPINRQFGVQITVSNPKFGAVQPRVTLSKWWPGGRTTFHFPNPNQWYAVERIINSQ